MENNQIFYGKHVYLDLNVQCIKFNLIYGHDFFFLLLLEWPAKIFDTYFSWNFFMPIKNWYFNLRHQNWINTIGMWIKQNSLDKLKQVLCFYDVE